MQDLNESKACGEEKASSPRRTSDRSNEGTTCTIATGDGERFGSKEEEDEALLMAARASAQYNNTLGRRYDPLALASLYDALGQCLESHAEEFDEFLRTTHKHHGVGKEEDEKYSSSGETNIEHAITEILEQGEERLQKFLNFCAEHEIDLPKDLRHSLSKKASEFSSSSGGLFAVPLNEEDEYGLGFHEEGRGTSILSMASLKQLRRASIACVLSESMPQPDLDEDSKFDESMHEFKNIMSQLRSRLDTYDLRVENASYTVTNHVERHQKNTKNRSNALRAMNIQDGDDNNMDGLVERLIDDRPRVAEQEVETFATSNIFGQCARSIRRLLKYGTLSPDREEKTILSGVNLYLETGKMFLVLGGPGSGKSTLLKYISDRLITGPDYKLGGSVSVAGIKPKQGLHWNKLAGYIDQIDRLHPYLTVKETLDFAFNCRCGGTHKLSTTPNDDETRELIARLDAEQYLVNQVLNGMVLKRVKDTFVGDQETVRGVSGGEKKRVTVGEMLCVGALVNCMDEISTGLDAAATYRITCGLRFLTKMSKSIQIISLLQPPPETVANFDELILMAGGYVIYSGPLENVVEYFNQLGYEIPERMDVADWLQALPTAEGSVYMKQDEGAEMRRHKTPKDFHEAFYASELGLDILEKLQSPVKDIAKYEIYNMLSVKFCNPWYKSLKLVCRREILLYFRNKLQIKAKVMQALIMGVLHGTVFFQSTETASNVLSVCFSAMMNSAVGSMVSVVQQFPDRSIFYKHQDASFFPPSVYVTARCITNFPSALTDAIVYGSLVFWLVGLAYNDGATIANYFIFLAVLFTTSFVAGFVFSVFPSVVQVVTTAQAGNALMVVVLVLFSGFTVQPDVIPTYYRWIYHINPFAWLLRALLVNEFDSGKYEKLLPGGEGQTIGEVILTNIGLTDSDGNPFTMAWVGWGVAVSMAIGLFCMVLNTFFYSRVRFSTGKTLVTDKGDESPESFDEDNVVNIPFLRVDLTFRDLHYYVTSSITNERLELLQGIDGVIYSGKITALMGSSGAGKTTLMDVIAMRKTSGEVTGDIRLNGHPQEKKSFQRCMGYVVQFDTQSAQLTVRETLLFSAKLRLNETDPVVTSESVILFVDQTLAMLELTNIQNLQIGTDETGGLSFEQKKRLSIAVEVVANPSIIFLDEPTSGLDARAAATVMRGMKRMAKQGRAVCATIHQPSIAIFNEFDRLILLKRGGEIVFQGDIGEASCRLVDYFQRFPATKPILSHENPATWMLTTIGAGGAGDDTFDYAASYSRSKLRSDVLTEIDAININASAQNFVTYASHYAASKLTQYKSVLWRTMLVYYRSPTYIVTRNIVSGVIAVLFSSVYLSDRIPTNESEMTSRVNSIYISSTFLWVYALNSTLSLFERERNMFYIHRNSNMYRPRVLIIAYTLAEIPIILYSAMIYCVLFYFIMGFSLDITKFFLYFLFTMFGIAYFTFTGQMMVSLLRNAQTAQGFGSLVYSFTTLFSGVLINPIEIPFGWTWMYWLLAGHWVFEGLFMSQYEGDQTQIEASCGTPFYYALNCTSSCGADERSACYGSAEFWISVKFPSWSTEHIKYDIIYLTFLLIVTRTISWWALYNFNHQSN